MTPAVSAILLAALDEHCETCEQCNGTNDGCEFGGGVEHLMLAANTYGYEVAPQIVTRALSTAVLRIMAGKSNVVRPEGWKR